MNFSTTYLGMKLKNPLVAAASPLSNDASLVKKMEDDGAAAVVMYSLFEEQISHENKKLNYFTGTTNDSFAEALSYFPEQHEFHNMEAEDYLEHIQKLKSSVDIPIIASLNGVTPGGWISYAKKVADAGADAIELNIYYIAADPKANAASVESMYLHDLKLVKENVDIPVSVKLGPYFSSFANFAIRLENEGADGLVLFNRFYQPDINLDTLEVEPSLKLSTTFEKRLPLRWIAILRPHLQCSLAASTGIHNCKDVIKMILAGADIATMASVFLRQGTYVFTQMLNEMQIWMEEKGYESVDEMRGAMSSATVADPSAFERANYLKALQSFRMEDLPKPKK